MICECTIKINTVLNAYAPFLLNTGVSGCTYKAEYIDNIRIFREKNICSERRRGPFAGSFGVLLMRCA
jgi:hypothetical protein